MTRINVVPVEELTDNFLLAEHHELPRVFLLVHRQEAKGHRPAELRQDGTIPAHYRFGRGHVGFFYDKLDWLTERHRKLRLEAGVRGLRATVDPASAGVDPSSFRHTDWWGWYVPTPEAVRANWDRLQERRRYDGGMYTV